MFKVKWCKYQAEFGVIRLILNRVELGNTEKEEVHVIKEFIYLLFIFEEGCFQILSETATSFSLQSEKVRKSTSLICGQICCCNLLQIRFSIGRAWKVIQEYWTILKWEMPLKDSANNGMWLCVLHIFSLPPIWRKQRKYSMWSDFLTNTSMILWGLGLWRIGNCVFCPIVTSIHNLDPHSSSTVWYIWQDLPGRGKCRSLAVECLGNDSWQKGLHCYSWHCIWLKLLLQSPFL